MSRRQRTWESADEFLDEWAELSARSSPAPGVRRQPMSLAAAVVSALSLAFLVIVGLAVVGLADRPGPEAPPAGGPRVVILPTVPSPGPLPPGAVSGCRQALAAGVLAGDPDDKYVAWLAGIDGARQTILWPLGYSARFDPDLALIGPTGSVIARAGDRLELGGGIGEGDSFSVDCGSVTVVTSSPSPESSLETAPTPTPEPVAGPAEWRLQPAYQPSPASTSIRVLLMERACANGLSPEGRIQEPELEYREDAVVITLTVETIGGDCPSNPEYPLTVELSEPLGDRSLVDAGVDPPAVRWPGAGPSPSPTPVADLDDCDGLELPPFVTGGADVMDTNLDRTNEILEIYIFGEGDDYTLIRIRYTDAACRDHPEIGPIIEHVLDPDS